VRAHREADLDRERQLSFVDTTFEGDVWMLSLR
jgi:hypothetical protein